jgi:hypothetical protein
MPIGSTAALVDVLRGAELLPPAQLDAAAGLQPRFPNSQDLAHELVQRGWLTPFQAEELLRGQGEKLALGQYLLLELLGEGGAGRVFKARKRGLGHVVALKVIRQDRLDNPRAVGRFRQEVQAIARLSHPNIVVAHDADQAGGLVSSAVRCLRFTTSNVSSASSTSPATGPILSRVPFPIATRSFPGGLMRGDYAPPAANPEHDARLHRRATGAYASTGRRGDAAASETGLNAFATQRPSQPYPFPSSRSTAQQPRT